jgi:methionine synthase reductase
MFESMKYTVLGLGDTNYDKFCHMGKSIDKRLQELGGQRISPLCCADEATGLEETVEKWKSDIMEVIESLINSQTGENFPIIDKVAAEKVNDVSMDSQQVNSEQKLKTNDSMVQTTLPVDIMNSDELCKWLNVIDQIKSQPSTSDLPRVKALSSSIVYPAPQGLITKPNVFPNEWNAENPYTSNVLSASYLSLDESVSAWEDVRKVIQVEISLADSGILYEPGDTIGICCPNPDFHVNAVLRRLQQYYASDELTLKSEVFDTAANAISTIDEILRYRYDLTGPPKKAAVFTLSRYCSDPEQATFMQWLCSKSAVGQQLWKYFIEYQRIGIAELLELLPSCCPSLEALMSSLTPMPPRFYSIASSQLAHNNSLVFAFSVVRYTCSLEHPITKQRKELHRYGVCTSYLEKLFTPLLLANASTAKASYAPQIKIFHKSNVNFRLPGTSSTPLIFVGPGTGVAPFIGFLEHIERSGLERARSGGDISTGVWRGGFEVDNLPCESGYVGQFINASQRGAVYLFFGCRHPSDYLFRNFLEEKAADGTLTCLDVAMSRVGPEKVYVTHKIEERGSELCDLLMNKGASLYICGDGNDMAKSVHESLKKIFVQHGGLEEKQAIDFMEDLKHRRRYLLDIWS